MHMKNQSTKDNSVRRIKIDQTVREACEKRDRSLDNDPDAPVLAPEMWDNAIIGKYYRARKASVTFRCDLDVLAWLKSLGEGGHLTRINQFLREKMESSIK
jgi:uncharacterized protein (DUF4415 family)